MNEKIDFNEKNKIEELACDVLIKILDVPHQPNLNICYFVECK